MLRNLPRPRLAELGKLILARKLRMALGPGVLMAKILVTFDANSVARYAQQHVHVDSSF